MVSKTIELARAPGVRIPPAPVLKNPKDFLALEFCFAQLHTVDKLGDSKRSVPGKRDKALALRNNAAHGCAGSAQAGWREQTGRLRPEPRIPPALVKLHWSLTFEFSAIACVIALN